MRGIQLALLVKLVTLLPEPHIGSREKLKIKFKKGKKEGGRKGGRKQGNQDETLHK